jgi:hypothetical protein
MPVNARLQQVLHRLVVFLQAIFAEAEKGERRAVLWRKPRDFPELVSALGELVERVIRRALIPVAFYILRPELHRLRVERDRVVPPLGLPRLVGVRDDLVELRACG